ncbi:unnamed protein product [Camellia sinensis]
MWLFLETRSVLLLRLLRPLSLSPLTFRLCEAPAIYPLMASEDRGRPLPKFGEWDVNNPASADGFTVIFAKARDDKKTNGNAVNGAHSAQKNDNNPPRPDLNSQDKKWFCCF